MTPCVRHALHLIVGLSVLALGGLSAPPTLRAAGDADSCTALQNWARERYVSSHLTLNDLTPYDPAQRRAIASVLTPERRAALWQAHLERFSHRRDLSPAQRGLVRDASAVYTPALYAGDRASQLRAEGFRAEIERLFTSTAHRHAWSQLGSIAPDGEIVLPPPATNARALDCNCRTSWDCAPGSVCGAGFCNQVQNCGPGGSLSCTGRCN